MATPAGPEQRDVELAEALAKRFELAVAARDLERIGEIFTDDLLYEHPALPDPLRGRAALLAYWRDLFAALPDLAFRQLVVFRAFDDPRVVGTFTSPRPRWAAECYRARFAARGCR